MAYEYRTKSGDVLDVLCAKIYRRDDMIPTVLQANTHLFDYSAVLPMGLTVVFPDPPVTAEKTVARGGLWGDA
jgi:phage tail protein X